MLQNSPPWRCTSIQTTTCFYSGNACYFSVVLLFLTVFSCVGKKGKRLIPFSSSNFFRGYLLIFVDLRGSAPNIADEMLKGLCWGESRGGSVEHFQVLILSQQKISKTNNYVLPFFNISLDTHLTVYQEHFVHN